MNPLIAVLGTSRTGERSKEYADARAIGREIARRGGTVICGGYGGVMEAACRGASEAGGESVGIVLAGRGEPNRWVSRAEAVADLGDRLRRLRDLPRAWIYLPRGLGTLLEAIWVAESIVKQDSPPGPMVFLGDFWRAAIETAVLEAAGPGAGDLARSVRWASTAEDAVALAFATRD